MRTSITRCAIFATLLFAAGSARAYGPAVCDFDGDGRSDKTIARDSGSSITWWVLRSTAGPMTFQWGLDTDLVQGRVLCGDFDGDGLDDATIWRSGAQGVFWAALSAGGTQVVPFGTTGDDPSVMNDFDGDGVDDMAIFRPSTGQWWIRRSSSPGSFAVVKWGQSGDVPHSGDFNNDGAADFLIRRNGVNWLLINGGTQSVFHWGLNSDKSSALDFTGDATADLAMFRPASGTWHVRNTATTAPDPYSIKFGDSTSTPVPGDYDAAAPTRAEIAVYFPNGFWWTRSFATSVVTLERWGGVAGDLPVNGFPVK